MDEYVWMSTAPGHPSNLRPLLNDISETDRERFDAARASIKAGEPIAEEDFPKHIFGAPGAKDKDYNFPDLFTGYGYYVVSARAADVLRQFDLGGGGLHPVKVSKKDRQTEVPGPWFCVNFGNAKEAFLPDKSENAKHGYYIRPGVKGWLARAAMKDGDFAVSEAARNGPDIWIDLKVGDAVFLSRALGDALKKAKADKGFFMKKCRIVTA